MENKKYTYGFNFGTKNSLVSTNIDDAIKEVTKKISDQYGTGAFLVADVYIYENDNYNYVAKKSACKEFETIIKGANMKKKKHAFTFYADQEEISDIIAETRKKRYEKDGYFFKSDSSVLEYLVRGGK